MWKYLNSYTINVLKFRTLFSVCFSNRMLVFRAGTHCYDIKPVRKEEGKSYWKIPLCDDDATREK